MDPHKNKPDDYYGRIIANAEFADNELRLDFKGGGKVKIFDGAWGCCEKRYMSTDDDPKDLVGKTLTSIETKDGPTTGDNSGEHEIQFLEVRAGSETVTFAMHNEHNGYYGGFDMRVATRP